MRLGLVPDLLKGVGLAPCLQLVPGEKRREGSRGPQFSITNLESAITGRV